ncbi:UNVERIFIED_CONTAM: hypothetical protein Slati_0204300 [Sesamum latifolium]|uniref:Uncharacterized protein n=1 Tax=Sesamum latifolium TaxID=2727402 RepID=A0AAW2YBF4_9LAMI
MMKAFFDMNGLEESLHKLINMLVRYEVMIEKSVPSILMGEASTSKAKGKGCRMRGEEEG